MGSGAAETRVTATSGSILCGQEQWYVNIALKLSHHHGLFDKDVNRDEPSSRIC